MIAPVNLLCVARNIQFGVDGVVLPLTKGDLSFPARRFMRVDFPQPLGPRNLIRAWGAYIQSNIVENKKVMTDLDCIVKKLQIAEVKEYSFHDQ